MEPFATSRATLAPDLPGCFVGRDRGELDQWVVDLDKEVDLVSFDLGSTERIWHLGVDLGDDKRGRSHGIEWRDRVDTKTEPTVGPGGTHVNDGGIESERTGGCEQPGPRRERRSRRGERASFDHRCERSTRL